MYEMTLRIDEEVLAVGHDHDMHGGLSLMLSDDASVHVLGSIYKFLSFLLSFFTRHLLFSCLFKTSRYWIDVWLLFESPESKPKWCTRSGPPKTTTRGFMWSFSSPAIQQAFALWHEWSALRDSSDDDEKKNACKETYMSWVVVFVCVSKVLIELYMELKGRDQNLIRC